MQLPTLTAGTTVDLPITAPPDYLASAGWSLKVRLVPRAASGAAVTYSCAADGDDYRLQVVAASATWVAGDWNWAAWVEQGSERHAIGSGLVTIRPDPTALAAGYDGRSQAQRMLQAIEATIEGRASSATQEYEIAGRRLRYIPIPELLTLRDKLRVDVAREEAAAAMATGLSPRGRMFVRFGR